MEVKIRDHKSNSDSDYASFLRKCSFEDFQKRGVEIKFKEISAMTFNNSFCPDMKKLGDLMQLKNGWLNNHDRISFSVQITKCTEDEN